MASYKDDIIQKMKSKLEDNPYGKAMEESSEKKHIKLTSEQKETYKRLNFSAEDRIALGARVGFICSYPGCNQATLGPDKGNGFVVLGEAAHIVGASNSTYSPRFSSSMSEEEIKSVDNGIWLCRHHHKLVDAISTSDEFSVSELKKWKKNAEDNQYENIKEKDHSIVKRFVIPVIDVDYIDVSKFKNPEYSLIMFLDDIRNGDRFIANYREWLSCNGIKPSNVDLDGDWFNNWEKHENNLAGLVCFSDGEFFRGDHFEDFIYDLKAKDVDYKKTIIECLKQKY